jgi:hypothetical protein
MCRAVGEEDDDEKGSFEDRELEFDLLSFRCAGYRGCDRDCDCDGCIGLENFVGLGLSCIRLEKSGDRVASGADNSDGEDAIEDAFCLPTE